MAQITMPDFDKTELSPPSLDAGDYEVNVTEKPEYVVPDDGGKQYLTLVMQATAGPEQSKPHPVDGTTSAAGRTIRDRIYLTKEAGWRLKAALVSAGILARDDKESPLAKGNINSDILMGAHLKIQVTKRMKDGNEYSNVTYVV